MISAPAFEQLSLSPDLFTIQKETYDTGELITFVQVPRYHALSPVSFSRRLVVRNQVIKNTKSVWQGAFGSRYFTPKNTSFRRTFWSRLGTVFFLPFYPLLFLRDVIAGLVANLQK